MELQAYVAGKSFSEAKSALSAHPHNMKIKESAAHPSLFLVMYDMMKTDWSTPFAHQCRGTILEKDTNRVVCLPLTKFWNHGESRAHKIDWSTATVQEKYDGSLIKIYHYRGNWIVATNGTIDSREASVGSSKSTGSSSNCGSENSDCKRSFFDIFLECYHNTLRENMMQKGKELCSLESNFPFGDLNPNYVYLLEAMHPKSRIVVHHDSPQLRHLATRDMRTLREVKNVTIHGVPPARTFPCTSLVEVLDLTKAFPDPSQFEGFVVVDAEFNRVKIKTLPYVSAHHCFSKLIEPDAFLMLCLLQGEASEILAYMKEYNERLSVLKSAWAALVVLITGALVNALKLIQGSSATVAAKLKSFRDGFEVCAETVCNLLQSKPSYDFWASDEAVRKGGCTLSGKQRWL